MELTAPALMKALMDQRGLSGRRLAHNARVSESMIRKLLRGEKKTCTPDLARRICRELGLSDAGVLFVPKVRISDVQDFTSNARRAA